MLTLARVVLTTFPGFGQVGQVGQVVVFISTRSPHTRTRGENLSNLSNLSKRMVNVHIRLIHQNDAKQFRNTKFRWTYPVQSPVSAWLDRMQLWSS